MQKTWWLTFIFFWLLYCLFPGDISWIRDEPLLIGKALEANRKGELASIGLTGTKNVPYGSVPTWIYQLLLYLFPSLIAIVIAKTSFVYIVTIITLKKICQKLNFNLFYSFIPVVSGYFYYYSRILWDNCFLIPFSCLFIYFLLCYSHDKKYIHLLVLSIIVSVLIKTHLLSVLLLVPSLSLFFIYNYKYFSKNILKPITFLFLILVFNIDYFFVLLSIEKTSNLSGVNYFGGLNFLLGAYQFSYYNFFEKFLPEIFNSSNSWVLSFLIFISSLIVLPFIIGVCKSLFYKKYDFIYKAGVVSLLMASIMAISLRVKPHPHYLNIFFPVYFILICSGLNCFSKYRKTLYAFFSTSFILLICFMSFVKINSGNRTIYYGATLNNQILVASKYLEYKPGTPIISNVTNYNYYPYSFNTLVVFLSQNTKMGHMKAGNLVVDYKKPEDEFHGEIVLNVDKITMK